MKKKERVKNNRTLTLVPEEIQTLKEKLLTKEIITSQTDFINKTLNGDVVFDPFLGSGTASVVAKKLGKNFCGIEQKEGYCLWTEKRLQMAESDCSIQGYSDGVFWECNTLNLQFKLKN